jgi:hypothetical protein
MSNSVQIDDVPPAVSKKAIIVTGNPVDGLQFHGPFESNEEAIRYAEVAFDEEWWVTSLEPINSETDDENSSTETHSTVEGAAARYVVSVCRTGYGHRDIEVTARSEAQAVELALDEARNHEYSESSSDYSASGVTKL